MCFFCSEVLANSQPSLLFFRVQFQIKQKKLEGVLLYESGENTVHGRNPAPLEHVQNPVNNGRFPISSGFSPRISSTNHFWCLQNGPSRGFDPEKKKKKHRGFGRGPYDLGDLRIQGLDMSHLDLDAKLLWENAMFRNCNEKDIQPGISGVIFLKIFQYLINRTKSTSPLVDVEAPRARIFRYLPNTNDPCYFTVPHGCMWRILASHSMVYEKWRAQMMWCNLFHTSGTPDNGDIPLN